MLLHQSILFVEIKSESEIASSIHTDESYSKSTKTNSDSYTETFESATSVSSVTSAPKVQKAEKTTPKQSEIAVQTESVKIESETGKFFENIYIMKSIYYVTGVNNYLYILIYCLHLPLPK